MTTKPMAPFPQYPPKFCENPDCKKGIGDKPAEFTPKTPWQHCCSKECRDHRTYLLNVKPKRQAARKDSEQSGA
jgi:hypothetical protein